MKLPNYRRIYKQDYSQDEQPLVEKLATSINNGFETLYDFANKKITLSDNISSTVSEVELSVNASGIPTKTTIYKLDFDGRVGLVVIGKLTNVTNSTVYPTQSPFVTWIQSDKSITIQHVTGLQPNYVYRLKLVSFKE